MATPAKLAKKVSLMPPSQQQQQQSGQLFSREDTAGHSFLSTADRSIKRIIDDSTRRTLEEYREKLAKANQRLEELEHQVHQQEMDAVEVIASLKLEKDELATAKIRMEDARLAAEADHKAELQAQAERYDHKQKEFEAIIETKNSRIHSLEKDIEEMKSFQSKRDELLESMARQKYELVEKERKYQERIAHIEKRSFEEKLKIQKDANRKAKELVIQAHQEAIQNLDRTTKSIYAENLKMAEALQNHIGHTSKLQKMNGDLIATNRKLAEEKEMHSVIIKDKIVQTKAQNVEIKDLNDKIATLEYSLTHVVRVFEQERESIARTAKKELDFLKQTADVLRITLKKKSQEMRHIRRLALHVLYQRTDMERFFMDALEFVRNEIRREESLKKRRKARMTPEEFEEQLKEQKREKKLDISAIAWKDKERILRLLFAKMNGLVLDKHQGQNTLSPHQKQDLALSVALRGKEIDKRAVDEALNINLNDILTAEQKEAEGIDAEDEDDRPSLPIQQTDIQEETMEFQDAAETQDLENILPLEVEKLLEEQPAESEIAQE